MDIAPTLLHMENMGFSTPVHGINLIKRNGNPVDLSSSNRDFMVIGHPNLVRSLEWTAKPFSFIMNVDHWYKSWYISYQINFPEEKLTTVPKNRFQLKYFKKSDKYSIHIDYPALKPNNWGKGLFMGILRFDIKNNAGLSILYNNGSRIKAVSTIKENKRKVITAYLPVTPLDRLNVDIHFKKGTVLEHFRYAIVPAGEVTPYLKGAGPLKSNIFKKLASLRKHMTQDEWYDLEKDFEMVNNLIFENQSGATMPHIIKAKKRLYWWLDRYNKERKQLTGNRSQRTKPLSHQEKEMLKSLGYL
jgi:hypothetical protein